jgi:hypothetical protein
MNTATSASPSSFKLDSLITIFIGLMALVFPTVIIHVLQFTTKPLPLVPIESLLAGVGAATIMLVLMHVLSDYYDKFRSYQFKVLPVVLLFFAFATFMMMLAPTATIDLSRQVTAYKIFLPTFILYFLTHGVAFKVPHGTVVAKGAKIYDAGSTVRIYPWSDSSQLIILRSGDPISEINDIYRFKEGHFKLSGKILFNFLSVNTRLHDDTTTLAERLKLVSDEVGSRINNCASLPLGEALRELIDMSEVTIYCQPINIKNLQFAVEPLKE